MEHLLKAKGLWGHVTGDAVLAAGANQQAQADHQKKDEKAFSILVLSISTSQIYLVTSCENPKDAWDTLRHHYERETLANKLYLKKSYYRAEMKEGMPVQQHLKHMKELADQLAAIGAAIPVEDQMVTLLGSLPQSYSTLVTALEAQVDDLTLQFVQQALINEEQKRTGSSSKVSEVSDGSCSAMLYRTHSYAGSSNANKAFRKFSGDYAQPNQPYAAPVGELRKGRKPVQCYSCGMFGHIKRNCPNPKQPESRKSVYKGRKMNIQHSAENVEHLNVADAGEADEYESRYTAFAAHLEVTDSSAKWLIDSGASKHMTYQKEILVDYRQFNRPQQVGLGDGRTVEAVGVGNVLLRMNFKVSEPKEIIMHNVLYIPKLSSNLFSVGSAAEKGNIVQFGHSRCWIRDKAGKLHGMGERSADGLYQLDCTPVIVDKVSVATEQNIDLWHQRLGHLNSQQLKQLVREEMATGAKIPSTAEVSFCEGCIEGKMHRLPFKAVGDIRSKQKLQLVHTDVCGPMQTESIGGCKYFVTFIDDYSRCCKVYFMKQKNEVLQKFKEFEALVTSESGERIGKLRSDNGGEYVSKEFEQYLQSRGIHHETTVVYTPEQNGVAERKNRTLVESARSMLCHAGLPRCYWAEAIATAAHVGNRIPTSAVKETRTPFERWYGRKPDLRHLKVFGCMAYAHVPDEKRQKLDKKAVKLRFVGYDSQSKGYRLFDEQTRKCVVRRDVIFNENDFGLQCSEETKVRTEVDMSSDSQEVAHVRPKRQCGPPVRYGFDEYADVMTSDDNIHHTAYLTSVIEPRSMEEAMSSDCSKEWKAAADAEYESLILNDTWELTELPPGRKPVGCKWIFRLKYGSSGNIERFKGRVVAKGYSQKYGIDYDETFSPVVRFSSVRTLLAYAVENDMMIHQMDVNTAFLNGSLNEEIYMEQPEGYVVSGKEHLVCKLKKSIYGLKQSPRCWNSAFHQHMEQLGFKQSSADPCVYIQTGDSLNIIAVYVDDLILICKSEEEMLKLKRSLSARFSTKDMGELHYCLGINIFQDKEQKCLWLNQELYIKKLIQKYGLSDAKEVHTPADLNVKLLKDDSVSKPVDPSTYQSMVGSLLYAAIATRPDISQAVSVVSKFNSCPTEAHLTAVKRILRYLKGTASLSLKYQKTELGTVTAYSDADWAGDLDDRHSTSGNIFIMANAAVSWLSKKQATVSLSTSEAEYVALSTATQEAVWLKKLLTDLGAVPDKATVIMEDNQGAIAMARNPVGHARTKHIDIRYHFVRECVAEGTIELVYCPTKLMLADLLTKPLPREQFERLRSACFGHG